MSDKKREYIELAAPQYWFSYAQEHSDLALSTYDRSGGEEIWTVHLDGERKGREARPVITRPVFLLLGVAIENLIKGTQISEDPMLLSGGALDRKLLGHNLRKLALQVKCMGFSDQELQLLDLLSDAVPYLGRYPVPKRFEDVRTERFVDQEIVGRCELLFQRIALEFYRLNYNGLQAPNGVRFPALRLSHLDSFLDFEVTYPKWLDQLPSNLSD